MERRKLVIEKVLDGESLIRSIGLPKLKDWMWANEYQRFVVEHEDLRRVPCNDSATPKPPFDDVWLEVVFEGGNVSQIGYCASLGVASLFTYDGDLAWIGDAHLDWDGGRLSFRADVTPAHTRVGTRAQVDKVITAWAEMLRKFFELLNVQGDVVRERLEAPAEVNAKRAKRGKPQLQPYTYVYLNRETDHSDSVESTGRVMSQHIRRGHFKRTRHGTFWWRPCVVGSGPAKERKAYIVKS